MKKIFVALFMFIGAVAFCMPPSDGGVNFDGSIKPSFQNDLNKKSPSFGVEMGNSLSVGNKNVLILLIDFSDKKFEIGHDGEYYSNVLAGNGSALTMRQYYKDMSNNKLDLDFTILGPYHGNNSMAYYGADGVGRIDVYTPQLITEAINSAIADKGAGFFDKFDNDGNGSIDFLIVLHAGLGQEQVGKTMPDGADCIWSHSWTLTDAKNMGVCNGAISTGTKTFDRYIAVCEMDKSGESTIGLFCHEFGHTLGLGDLYDTSYDTCGVGAWSLMAAGSWGSAGLISGVNPGSNPAAMLAYERNYLGWLDFEQIVPSFVPQIFSINNINDSYKAYKINLNADGSQYLLLEGIKKNNTGGGMYAAEGGLLVTHIHEKIINRYYGSNTVNNTSTRPHGINILEAVSSRYYTSGDGTGNLWEKGDVLANRYTDTALYRLSTRTYIKSEVSIMTAAISLLLLGGSALWRKKRKFLGMLGLLSFIVCLFFSCSMGGGGDSESGGGSISYPNTNYYTSETSVNSKNGYSGVDIYDIDVNESGTGTFKVRLINQ